MVAYIKPKHSLANLAASVFLNPVVCIGSKRSQAMVPAFISLKLAVLP